MASVFRRSTGQKASFLLLIDLDMVNSEATIDSWNRPCVFRDAHMETNFTDGTGNMESLNTCFVAQAPQCSGAISREL